MRNKEYENEIYELHNDIAKLNALLNEYLPEMEDYRQRRKMKLTIAKAKAELKEAETSAKMILASTARVATQHSQEKISQKAKQTALDELPFLDQATRKAMYDGKYCATYWWSNAIWEEYEVSAEDFAKAITKLLENYGYQVFNTSLIKQKDKIVKVEIMWDWSREHE